MSSEGTRAGGSSGGSSSGGGTSGGGVRAGARAIATGNKGLARDIPHGRIPYQDIADPVMRQKVMLLNDNIENLRRRVDELARTVLELKRR